jgi:alpha-glucuronidase
MGRRETAMIAAKRLSVVATVAIAATLAVAPSSTAQTADQAWLRYRPVAGAHDAPTHVVHLGNGIIERTAADELIGGLQALYGRSEAASDFQPDSIILGTYEEIRKMRPSWKTLDQRRDDATIGIIDSVEAPPFYGPFSDWNSRYEILRDAEFGPHSILIAAPSQTGVLYGSFALLRSLAMGEDVPVSSAEQGPTMPIRWVDEWDNPDGSIERGYAGRSIFFEDGNVREDLAPVAEYARLLASIGINGCNVNNVNAAPQLLDRDHLKQLSRIAGAMRPWGVRLAMSVDIASPQKIGGLTTYDPLDSAVKAWWAAKVDEIYKLIPDFAGFTVKADSEGQPGPSSFGRTPADAANTLAAALAPHGGVVLYRAFVYNHHLDWNDPKADRARAAYDIFHPLDGKFAPNVIVQTKEGPIDFQAREPVSPLFGGLRETNQAMEVQITQEYTGQQRHLVYLAPMWKEVLDFDMRVDDRSTPVKEILAGKPFNRPLGGMVGVAGVGRDAWLGSPLALANLYAFGRLAWDPNLTAEQIGAEWVQQTISNDQAVVGTVVKMLMQSWPAYESYTGTLGLQTLTDITGSHYGPNVESSERNGWGQWHRADHEGVGMDRTAATGTGFAGQYPPEVAKKYESLESCPDNLLLFFHHVPYTYSLHSGKTVIQSIYDSHYEGATQAAEFVNEWDSLKGRIPKDPIAEKVFDDVRARLVYQAGHAIVWRDAIVQYFLKLSGIPDEKNRVGHYPGRLEAEDARLTGYKVVDVTPWEDGSGGKAVSCDNTPENATQRSCSAEWTWTGQPGRYNIAVQYFDLQGGTAKFALEINRKPVASWSADATLPSRRPNGDNSTRYTAHEIDLKPGDVIRVIGTPDAADPAAVDYIEVTPVRN